MLQDASTWAHLTGIDGTSQVSHRPDGVLEGFAWTAHAMGRTIEGIAKTMHAQVNDHMGIDIDAGAARGDVMVELSEPEDNTTELSVEITLEPKSLAATLVFPAIERAVGERLSEKAEDFRRMVMARYGATEG